MKKYYEELLEEFVKSKSMSGRSEEVATVFKRHADGGHFTTGVDMLGSVVARLVGQKCYLDAGYKRRILITAHQDSCDLTLDEDSAPNKVDNSVKGKYKAVGLDNKAGLLSMCILMDLTLKSKIFDDLYFVATSLDREEGLGSIVCAEKINPTIAINLDVVKVDKKSLLGKGPTVLNSPVINRKLFNLIRDIKVKCKIPAQFTVHSRSSDLNCSKLAKAAGGLACCDIRIPMYTQDNLIGMVSKKDVENCAKLVHKLIIDINRIENFLPEV